MSMVIYIAIIKHLQRIRVLQMINYLVFTSEK